MAFSTAITGLKASTTELDVTGNNIANSSTVGFKAARTEFSDIFATVVVGSGSANSPGSGVIVSDIAQDFTAGTIQFTNNNLDLAIDGTGFFQLNDGQGGITYTRSGGFELDKDGNVVSKNGNFLQGFGLDAAGNRQPIGNLSVSQKESPPKASSKMDLSFNIDSRATPSNLAYDPEDSSTFTFSTTNSTFDSLGNENTIKFDMIEQGAWRERQSISLNSFAALGLNAGDSFSLAGGTISVVAAAAPPNPALGEIGDDTTEANFAARVAAIFSDAATPLQNQVGWDNRIREISDDGSGNLEITWAASAADVRPVVLNHIDTVGTGNTTGLTNVNTQDPFFAANKVESYAFSVPAPPLTGTNPFITIGATQVGISTTMSASDIVDEIIKNTNAILSANPDIDTITKDTATGQLVIKYDAELGDEPSVAVSSTNVTGLTIGTGTFDETGDNSYQGVYQMHALFNNSTPLNIGRPPQAGSGLTTSEPGPILLTFDTTNGLLQTVNGSPVSATGSAPTVTISGADPANPNNTISLDLSGTTQFASESIVKASTQDGFTKGDLIGVTFSSEGVMVASFSNGQNSNLGIVALASFENQNGLQPVGDTAWSATLDSGQAILNPPGTGLNGQLRSAALEQSNVNLSEELVALIEAQRNFQANSKTLQTENQVTQTILQIN